MAWPAQEIISVPIGQLTPYENNARTHSEAQVEQIAASINEWGWTIPVLADENGQIIAGHGRILAAQRLGISEIPVMVARGWSEAQKRAYVLADNKLALNAGWDDDLLKLELEQLKFESFDLALTGFNDSDLESFEDSGKTAGADETEEFCEDLPQNPITKSGDLWIIDGHRLICGDATKASVVQNLMQCEKANLCFTSPPYGNQRDYKTGGINNWDKLMNGVCLEMPLTTDGQLLVNLGLIHKDGEFIQYWNNWLSFMGKNGWRRFGWYVWDQGPGMPGDWHGRLAPAFEFIFHLNKTHRRPNKIVDCFRSGSLEHEEKKGRAVSSLRTKAGKTAKWTHSEKPVQPKRIPDSVVRISRQKGAIGKGVDHPAVFPVALPEFVINAYSNQGEIVYEPFNGSGSSLIAAQRTGRKCRAVELAPEYVDVAIKRYLYSFPDAEIINSETGKTFEQTAAKAVAC